MNKVIVVVGPTATGKTNHCIELSRQLNTEVVNADSRQIYTGMDIGTAKPTPDQLKILPHHLVSIRAPNSAFNVNDYKELCKKSMQQIMAKNKTPIICGGSGQYIYSVINNWGLGGVPPDHNFRKEMYKIAEDNGPDYLHTKLKAIDSKKASTIDYRNIPRVVRALEIAKHPQEQQQKPDQFFADLKFLIIGLTCERSLLYDRIDTRVDQMIAAGLVPEVENLLTSGLDPKLPAFNSPGYRQIISYLSGVTTIEEAISEIKTKTHTLARKQYNWFKPQDPSINWFDSSKPDFHSTATRLAQDFLTS
tara:strand:+ start:2919 stop:3836 length:918 start_codon:yes stop_codon:yes gene_type:complete